MGLDGNKVIQLGSSRRTPGPITPGIGDCTKASAPLRKRDHTAYGSRRSPGRRSSSAPMTAPLAVISLLGLVLAMSPTAKAAELKMIAGGSMTGPLKQIVPQFERETGHKLVIHFELHAQSDQAGDFRRTARSRGGPGRCVQGPGRKSPFCRRAHHRYRPRRLWRHRSRRRGQARHQHAGRVEENPARRAIDQLCSHQCGRRLCAESVRSPRRRRGDESQNQAAAIAGSDRSGGCQGRRRSRGISDQHADRAGRRSGRVRFPPTCSRNWCSHRRYPPTARKPTPQRPSSTICGRLPPPPSSRPPA